MNWEDAIVKAMSELQQLYPEWAVAYLALTIRVHQLTTKVIHPALDGKPDKELAPERNYPEIPDSSNGKPPEDHF